MNELLFEFELLNSELKKAINLEKEYKKTFIPEIEEGDLVDVLDKVSIWRAAKIVRKVDKIVEVAFEGWTNRWNERKDLSQATVMPYRSQITGYTGSKKRKINDKQLIKTLILHLSEANRSILENENFMKEEDPTDITLRIRGSLFQSLNLLLMINSPLDSTALAYTNNILNNLILFILRYLDDVTPHIPLFLMASKTKNKFLYLLNRSVAVISSGYEIFELFENVMGLATRTRRLYMANRFSPKLEFDILFADRGPTSTPKSNQLLNMFLNKGGFTKIIDLIMAEWTVKNKEDKMIMHLPANFLYLILNMIKAILTKLDRKYMKQHTKKIIEAMNEYFKRISDYDVEFNILENYLKCLKYYYIFHSNFPVDQDTTVIDVEEIALSINLKYLSCKVFERKFQGIKLLVSRLENIEDEKDRAARRKFLLKSKILEVIYISGYHREVAQRSYKLLEFLSPDLNSKILLKLLDSAFAQSEEKASVICTTIKNVIGSLELEVVKDILSYLKKIDSSKIRPETIELVLQIIVQSVDNNSYFNLYKNKKEAQRVFDEALSFLWKCLQDVTRLSSSAVNTVLNALKNQATNIDEKKKLINLCLLNFEKGLIETQHIILLKHILGSLSNKSTLIMASSFDKVMDLIYSKMEAFTSGMLSELKKRIQSKVVEDHFIDDQIFNTRIKLIIMLIFKGKSRKDSQFSFNQLLRFLSEDKNKKDHLPRLLTIIKNKPIITKENSTIFFDIFESENQTLPSSQINLEIYKVFEKLFMQINLEGGAFKSHLSQHYHMIIKKEKILHLDTLWTICLTSKIKPEVKERFYKLLISCYFMSERKFEATHAFTAWNQFMTDARDYKSRIQTANELGNYAYIWTKALELCLGTRHLDSESKDKLLINVLVKNDRLRINKLYKMPYNDSLNLVRLKMMEDFNYTQTDLTITYYDKDLRPDHLELYSVGMALENKKESKDSEKLILGFYIKEDDIETPYVVQTNVRNRIANDAELSSAFLENIDRENTSQIWNLLISLPLNKQKLNKIYVMSNFSSLSESLTIKTPKHSLYLLHIVDQILGDKVPQISTQDQHSFKKRFATRGGTNLLISLVLDLKPETIEEKASVKLITNGVFKIMNHFLDDLFMHDQFKEYLTKSLSILQALLTCFKTEKIEFFEDNLVVSMDHIGNLISHLSEIGSISDLMNWGKLYTDAFQNTENEEFKEIFESCLTKFLKMNMNKEETVNELVVPLYKHCLPISLKNPHESQSLLKMISAIACEIDNKYIMKLNATHFDFNSKWEIMSAIIKDSKPSEEGLISSCINFLRLVILTEGDSIDDWVEQNAESLEEFLEICMVKSNGEQISSPLCTTKATLKAIYDFMLAFLNHSSTAIQLFYEYFEKLVKKGSWRSGKYQDWNNKVVVEEKKRSKYAGLKNLGCICYMNSVFQQLFMIPEFRDYIISADVKKDKDGDHQSNTLFQFQFILKSLRDVVRNFHSPAQFCRKVKIFEGEPINVLTQMDADEFLNHLLDKIETELKRSSQGNAIERTFGGEIVQEIIVKDHDYKSERKTPFMALPVEVKGNINLKQCLDQYITGEMLEGENQYYCEDLDQKVDALKRESIKRLPNVLIIVLKRFSFNYEKGEKAKINDFCEFPDKLDMTKYTQEFLNNKEGSKPSNYYNFNLRGVVIHKGSANSGHYYSLIKDQNAKWFEFNDTIVREFDYKDMAQEAYGDSSNETKTSIMTSNKLKGTNAYMLFYERESIYDENTVKIDTLLTGFRNHQHAGNKEISLEILHENFEHYMKKILLDNTFADFVCDSLEKIRFENLLDNLIILKIGFTCFMHLLMRKSLKEKIPRTYTILVKTIKCSVEVARWFFENACNFEFVQEFLIDCVVQNMKCFISGLLKVAIHTISEELESNKDDVKLLQNFTLILFEYAFRRDEKNKFLKQVYELIAELSEIPLINDFLSEILLPEMLISNLNVGITYEEKEGIEKMIEEAEIPNSVFSGYLGKDPTKEIISIEDIQWRKKEAELVKTDFTEDYSYIFLALSNVMMKNGHNHMKVSEELPENSLWRKILVNTKNRKCAFRFCDYFCEYVIEDPELSDKVIQSIMYTLTKNKDIEIHGFLYLLNKISSYPNADTGKRIALVLNVFAELLHEKNRNSYFEKFLGYMFFTLKENKKMFEKTHSKGKGFLIQVSDAVDKYINTTFKALSQKSNSNESEKALIKRLKSLKSQMIRKIDSIKNGNYEDYKDMFTLNYDFIFEPQDLKEVDYLVSDLGWRTFELDENLGVMMKIKNYYPISDKHRYMWVEFDDRRLAFAHTTTIEHKNNPGVKY